MPDSNMVERTVDFNNEIGYDYAIADRNITVSHESSTGLSPNISGLLCYVFGWISGIIMLLVKGRDGFVRFHAWQSIVVFGIITVPVILLNLLTLTDSVLYWFLTALYWVLIAASLCLWILLMLRAYQGRAYRLHPIENIVMSLSRTWGSMANGEVKLSAVAEKARPGIVETPQIEQKTKKGVRDSREVLSETIKSIITLCGIRDPCTAMHQRRVAQLASAIGREMGLSDDRIEGLYVMGTIHDIGKATLPTEILSKPGTLTSHEFAIIKTHPEVAYNIVKGLKFPWPVAQAMVQHHERLNGTGYPRGISGDDIILEAKILCVADVVDAMSSHRPYRPPLGISKGLEEISKNKSILYDAAVVDACTKLFTEKSFNFDEEESSSVSPIEDEIR